MGRAWAANGWPEGSYSIVGERGEAGWVVSPIVRHPCKDFVLVNCEWQSSIDYLYGGDDREQGS